MKPERLEEFKQVCKTGVVKTFDSAVVNKLLDHIEGQEKKIEALVELVKFAHDEGFDGYDGEVWAGSKTKMQLAEILK